MDGIILNTIAYLILSLGAFVAFDISTKDGSKFSRFMNFLMLFWCVFMTTYLITHHKEILSEPLNPILNFYETITNFFIGLYLLSFNHLRK